MTHRRLRILVATAGVGATLVLTVAPAPAHGEDPTLVPALRTITPGLPDGVIVQVRTTVSEQMIVANPTPSPLEVLDPDGTPFLRVSKKGALGNVASPFFHRTLNPPQVPLRLPSVAREGAPARWVLLSPGESWGWFEPRLHPFTPGAEPAGDAAENAPPVATWQVGMRLGSMPVQVSGVLERRVVTGSFQAEVDPCDDGIEVALGQGQIPALLLVLDPARTVEIEGADGVAFLRHGPGGVFANPDSVTFRDNPDFAERKVGSDGWARVGEPGRIRWLDTRLQYSADRPPEVVERRGEIAALGRWEIPTRVDGKAAPLRGAITWLPLGTDLAALRDDSGLPVPAMTIAGLALVGAGTVLVIARRRAQVPSQSSA
ncbi:MAG: hypothetical protein ACT4P1_08180 [Sporichthyaceae bacterium]